MINIALLSFSPIWLEPILNIGKCEQILSVPQIYDVDIVVLPEMALTGYSPEYGSIVDSLWQEIVPKLQSLAIRSRTMIVIGAMYHSHSHESNSRPANNALVISSEGKIIAEYSKINLFPLSREGNYVDPGKDVSIFSCKDYKFALSICYDLRFPELFSSVSLDVDCFINIASWPAQRIDHWYALTKARAVENQAFFIGVNRSGTDGNNLNYPLSSLVFDPLGSTIKLIPHSEFPELAFASLDLSKTKQIRTDFPFLTR